MRLSERLSETGSLAVVAPTAPLQHYTGRDSHRNREAEEDSHRNTEYSVMVIIVSAGQYLL